MLCLIFNFAYAWRTVCDDFTEQSASGKKDCKPSAVCDFCEWYANKYPFKNDGTSGEGLNFCFNINRQNYNPRENADEYYEKIIKLKTSSPHSHLRAKIEEIERKCNDCNFNGGNYRR